METSKEVEEYAAGRAELLTNMIYMLADGIDTLLVDVVAELDKLQLNVKQTEKMKVKRLNKVAKDFRKLASDLSVPVYNLKENNSILEDSDLLIDTVELLMDRMGHDHNKITQVRSCIFNFQSELNLYDKRNRI